VRAVALLSGGLDSVVATAAAQREHEVALALTFDYGQRAAPGELAAAQRVAQTLGIEHTVVALPWLAAITQTPLVKRGEQMPQVSAEYLDEPRGARAVAEAVWVPNRNGLFLNIAACYCEALDCRGIICGFNAEEGASFPDNTPEFVRAAEQCFAHATRRGLRVIAPTISLTKREIVELGCEIGAPLHLIWSCYEGEAEHCWRCPSCLRLRRALEEAGRWEQWQEHRAPLPPG